MSETDTEKRRRIARGAGNWCGGGRSIDEAQRRDGPAENPAKLETRRGAKLIDEMREARLKRKQAQAADREEQREAPEDETE